MIGDKNPFLSLPGQLISGLLMLFFWMPVIGQDATEETPVQEEETQPMILINTEYEDRLNRLFQNYFDPATYYVNVRAIITQQLADEPPTPRSVMLPGLPVTLSDAARDRRQRQSLSDFLAGLQPDISTDGTTDITILADTVHSPADLNFMQTLVAASIPFFPEQGDEIRVITQVFPRRITEQEPIMIQLTDPLPSFPQQLQLVHPDERREFSWHIWVAIGLALLLLTLILLIWYFSRKPSKATIEGGSSRHDIRLTQESSGERALVLPDRMMEPEPRPEPDHRTYLMGLFMERPIEVASLMERWIKLDEEKGSLKAAQLINNVDARFMLLIEKYMSKDVYETLLEASEDPASREKYETYEDFRDITKEVRQSLRDGTAVGVKEFEFIQFIDNDQLLRIAHETPDKDLALLVRQLPPKRTAWLLEQLGEERTRVIMTLVTKAETINYETLRDSAGKLFEKYFSMQTLSSFTKRDINKVMHTIEELPLKKQERYLSMLVELDPELYHAVSKQVTTWERLPMVDESILKEAMLGIDSKTIAQALKDAPFSFKKDILNLRPGREQVMIQEMMEEGDITQEQSDTARRAILEAVKETREVRENPKVKEQKDA